MSDRAFDRPSLQPFLLGGIGGSSKRQFFEAPLPKSDLAHRFAALACSCSSVG
jgi:hypothetical protein